MRSGPNNAAGEVAGNVAVEAAEGDAAGGVEQDAIPGVADAAPDRSFDVMVLIDGEGAAERRGEDAAGGEGRPERQDAVEGLVLAGAVDIAFEADDELIQLQIIADMRAADDAAGV